MSLQNQLSLAEQGVKQDQARLAQLVLQRDRLVAEGGNPTDLNESISDLQQDITDGQQDILDLNQEIEEDAAVAQQDTAQSALEDSGELDTGDEALEDAEEISDDEEQQIETADDEEDPDDFEDAADVQPPSEDDNVTSKSVVAATPATPTASNAEVIKPIPNPLHQYATYTYGITLYVLSKESYNRLGESSGDDSWLQSGAFSLISSGGGHHENRHPEFREDFYFDGLTVKTVIGMNATTRASNAIEYTFNIIEPYGITLLDRLMAVSEDKRIGAGNYLHQPYLLEVNFFGSQELGKLETPIAYLKKRFPIKIVEMKIKVGAKGTEYACRAIPWNHMAFNETNNSAPANFEIKATTVGEFFSALDVDEMAAQIAAKDQARSDAILARGIVVDDDGNPMPGVGKVGLGGDEKALESALARANTPYSVSSYAGAWNAWNQKVADDKHVKFANKIKFVIDKEIADSPIVDPGKMSYSRSDMALTNAKTAEQDKNTAVSSKNPSSGFDPRKMIFSISSGTSIIDTINLVLRNSDYIKSQVIDPLSDKANFKEEKEVNYFKIVPKISILDFDPFRNEYAREITYYIKKYTYYNTKHPNLPKSKINGSVKEYNYIYTGKNIDIIDVQIDFDTAFYTAKIVNRNNAEATSAAPLASDGSETTPDTAQKPAGAGTIAPSTQVPVNGDVSAQSTGADTAKTALVANVMKSIYSSSRGDMLNVKLKILGDPHFIKQDDVFVPPDDSSNNSAGMLLNPGTLKLDRGEIFCTLTFKSPVDMDDNTGLARFEKKYQESKFSGYYKVLTVDNEFKGGQFIQTLDLVRIFDNVPTIATGGTGLSTSTDTNREQTNTATAEAEVTDIAARSSDSSSFTDTDSDPSQADTVISVEDETTNEDEDILLAEADDNINEDEEFTDPELLAAEDENLSIAEDLADAEETDITTLITEDQSSPEPQNPIG